MRAENAAESWRRQTEVAVREHRRVGDELREEFEEVIREIREMEDFAIPEEVTAESIKAVLGATRSTLVPVEKALAGLEVSAAYARLVEQERVLAQARKRLAFRSELSGGGSARKLTSGSSQPDSDASGRRTR